MSGGKETVRPRRLCVRACVILLLLVTGLASAGEAPERDPVRASRLRAILTEQLDLYARAFPDIRFLVLEGSENRAGILAALSGFLGPEPVNLDYEHPPEMRATLVDASLGRIALMVHYQLPSATLFRSDAPGHEGENVCVLTIDACAIARDDTRATRFMLDLTEDEIGRVPAERRLQCEEHLRFTFEHEAYHCLSVRYGGAQPMSHEALWAEYWHFRHENGADAYAMARHLQRHGEGSVFADNLRRVRGMALYGGDVDHWTRAALDRVLALSADELAGLSPTAVFERSNRIRDAIVPDYAAYLDYRRAAVEAMATLGVDEAVVEEARASLPVGEPDPCL